MSVLVQVADDEYEQVEEACQIQLDDGALRLHQHRHFGGELVCVYAPGTWLYAEVQP